MLEYNFTELDNDFITLWSRYILTDDMKCEIKVLKELAEKGQINAIQSWYLFREIGDSPKIDAIVEGYKGDSYNEMFAKSNYAYADEVKFKEYEELMKKMEKAYEDWQRYDGEEDYRCFAKTRSEIYDHSMCANVINAINLSHSNARTTNNYLVFERMNEMKAWYANIAPAISQSELDELNDDIQKLNKTIIKELYKQYKKLIAQGKTVSDNPQLGFALGKACCLFPNTSKNRGFGLSLLKELAEREYTQVSEKTQFNI